MLEGLGLSTFATTAALRAGAAGRSALGGGLLLALALAPSLLPRCRGADATEGAGPRESAVAMYRGTPAHTGLAAAGETLAVPPSLRWRYEPVNVGIHTASKSSPVADDERVYVGADDERFYCLSSATGELVWRWECRPCRNGIHATAAVDGERVYVCDYAGWLTALDKRTGLVVWETQLGDHIGASPVIAGKRIYVGVELSAPDGYLAAVDRGSGTLIWKTRNLEDHTHCTPTLDVARGRIYIGSNRGHFHAFDTAGKQIWRFAARGAFDPLPDPRPRDRAQIKSTAALAGDRILFTSWDRRLYCLAGDTGQELWSFETDHRTMSSPSVDPTGRRVYFGSHDHNVYAVDLDTGKLIWRTTTGGRVYSSALLVPRADGTGMAVVIGSCDSRLYILDAADGTILWQRLLNGPVTSVPYIRNGRLLVSTNGGELVCFE